MSQETTRTHIVVPIELVKSVDSLVGRRGRSRFFSEAVAEKLARARRATIFKNAAGALTDRDVAGWETSDATAEWVRRLRAADDARLGRIQGDR